MTKLVCVIAHPDDETMFTGGTLAMLAQSGVEVHILCATRGEGGERGDPPLAEREELGRVREEELKCAARALGAVAVEFMGYVDPVVGPNDTMYAFEAELDDLAARIAGYLGQVGAELVLTHGRNGEYGHPAHRLVRQGVELAIERMGREITAYCFAARVPTIEDHIWNDDDPAHFALDVSRWLDAKEAAARCHKTQHVLFRRRGLTLRQALRKIEGFRRIWPRSGTPDDEFAALLRAAGATEYA